MYCSQRSTVKGGHRPVFERIDERNMAGYTGIVNSHNPLTFLSPAVGGEEKERRLSKKLRFYNNRTHDYWWLILTAVVQVMSIPIRGNFG